MMEKMKKRIKEEGKELWYTRWHYGYLYKPPSAKNPHIFVFLKQGDNELVFTEEQFSKLAEEILIFLKKAKQKLRW